MGSKKHKKESKKKKHRSKSRSPVEGEERERKRHRKHKDRKKDRSPDVEEVPVDSHLVRPDENGAHSRADSEDRDRRMRAQRDRPDAYSGNERERERERDRSPVAASSGTQESLSIEETNRLRAKLGLKPLEVTEKPTEDGKIKDDLGEFYHRPAANIAEQKKSEKIRERLHVRKEKRKLENKLAATRTLGEDSDDEDASNWVKKSREVEQQKKEAAKRAAMLDELDLEFGVGALVAEEQQQRAADAYTHRHLRGIRVAHDINTLVEEQETVLTLADKEVLAEDAEDVLVNVNMVDDERYKKNVVERKKAKSGYQAYDEESEVAAALGMRPVLAKYDEELGAPPPRGFLIGEDQQAAADQRLQHLMRQEVIAGGADKRLESLWTGAPRLASEYMDEHEIQAKFKKSKRKGKMRRKNKEEPIDVDDYEAGSAPLQTDDTDVVPSVAATLAVDEDELEPDSELQAALARARNLRRVAPPPAAPPPAPHVQIKMESAEGVVKKEEGAEEEESGLMVLDATAEFCRTLGDIPTYGLAGNRDHRTELMDFEREELEPEVEGEGASGAWSRVDVGNERPPDLAAGVGGGLDAEPALGAGVAGALRLARSKGYLERQGAAPPARQAALHLLQARHYSIEDKTYGGEDDKYGRRERSSHSGPLQDFREKSHFRPNIKLEYVDDEGRPLCPKEAFRYLSHKFHGKGPGKNKQEKRIKKAVQEGLMKKMSSTDTPLGTLQMLQDKQRETHSPFIVLSGAKRDQNT